MVVAASLFVRTLSNLQSIPLGFNPENLLLFELNARQAGHRDPEILTFYAELRRRFAEMPGIRNATLSHASLLGAGRRLDLRVSGTQAADVWILNTGPRFFSTMQIPLLVGREIDERDQPGSSSVVVVNERFAKIYFGNDNPIGRQITLGGPHPRNMEIVGVSADAHYGRLKNDRRPVVYIPYNQGDYPRMQQMVYALRTTGDSLSYLNTVREIVRQADTRIPVMNARTQSAEISRAMNQEILFARLCTGFAILALIIASVGLYGTIATRCRGARQKLVFACHWARHAALILRMILRQVLVLATVGLAIGLLVSFAASRLVESFLFGIKARDPLALLAPVGILIAATVFAGYIPARRASLIDPLRAIRHE